MAAKDYTIKINLTGGIVSAGDLYHILEAAEKAQVEHIRFGNRQQLFFSVAEEKLWELQQDLMAADIIFELNKDLHPNILSSYVTEDVFYHANWLREGVYKDILDLFDYRPQVKINLVDSEQAFVPFFTGNLNFIASETSNYWFLYIRFPKTNIIYQWPSLVYSEDIPGLSSLVEQVIFSNKERFYDQRAIDGNLLHNMVRASGNFVIQPITHPLRLPEFKLPYYEGFNRYGNKLWLGIYRRDEQFPLSFLKRICTICLQTRIGQLYTTPWKSLVIKGIELADRNLWDNVLSRYRINVRHASNELNWQVEDLCAYGLNLKNHLVRKFNEEDVRTYRLCFAIKTQPKTGLFGSIIIRTQQDIGSSAALTEELFEILYTRDFNPNSKDFISFKKGVAKEDLSTYLIKLCDDYYEQQSEPELLSVAAQPNEQVPGKPEELAVYKVYQCRNCYTMYDEHYGDEVNEVQNGTPFTSIPDYTCPTCGAPKADFVIAGSSLSLLQNGT
ncbi:rubredoxin [Pontibacter sp. SGAir0037]|uniref:rubredoxin n=1 Tax=Pontibacter sp. SGAir0037 TaxID=2571030 RepID=UPI0010CD07D0|nr:rubredoxin [Pontibacter sp. SGAir0037]QCR22875.1 rubredoxin [Pontibacter sp. SGAir0037]